MYSMNLKSGFLLINVTGGVCLTIISVYDDNVHGLMYVLENWWWNICGWNFLFHVI
jgi:hypothetical protein